MRGEAAPQLSTELDQIWGFLGVRVRPGGRDVVRRLSIDILFFFFFWETRKTTPQPPQFGNLSAMGGPGAPQALPGRRWRLGTQKERDEIYQICIRPEEIALHLLNPIWKPRRVLLRSVIRGKNYAPAKEQADRSDAA